VNGQEEDDGRQRRNNIHLQPLNGNATHGRTSSLPAATRVETNAHPIEAIPSVNGRAAPKLDQIDHRNHQIVNEVQAP